MDIRNFFGGGGGAKPAASQPASDAPSKLKAKKPPAKKLAAASNDDDAKPASKKRKTTAKGPAMTVEPPAPPKRAAKPISQPTKPASKPSTSQSTKSSSKSSKKSSVFSHMDDLDDEDQSDDMLDDLLDDDFIEETPKKSKSSKQSISQPIEEPIKSSKPKKRSIDDDDDDEVVEQTIKPSKKTKTAAKKRRIVDDEEDLVDWGGDDDDESNDQSNDQSNKQSTSQITKHFTTVTSEKELSKEENEKLAKAEQVRQEALKKSIEESNKRSKRRGDLIDNEVVAPVINLPDSSVPKPTIKQSVKREINPMDFFSSASGPTNNQSNNQSVNQSNSQSTSQSSKQSKSPAKKSPAKSRVYSSPDIVDLDSDVEIKPTSKPSNKQSITQSDAELAQQMQDEEDAKLRFIKPSNKQSTSQSVTNTPSKSPAKSTRSSTKANNQSTESSSKQSTPSKQATPSRKRKADIDIDLIDDKPTPKKLIKQSNNQSIKAEKSATPKKSTPSQPSKQFDESESKSATKQSTKTEQTSVSIKTESSNQSTKSESSPKNESDAYEAEQPKKKGLPAWKQDRAASLGMSKEIPDGAEGCLSGLTFVITGVLDSLERDEAANLVQKYGGRVTSAVSKKTDYLLCGADGGESKVKKAKECKTKVIDEDGLLQMIATRKGQSMSTPTNTAANKKAQLAAKEVEDAVKAKAKAAKEAAAARADDDDDVETLGSTKRAAPAESSMLWVDKHKPLSVKGVIGNPGQIDKLGTWLQGFQSGLKHSEFKRALLISGGPGIGKSTTAALVARERGFHVIELNASDVRNKTAIQSVVGELTTNTALSDYFKSSTSTKALPKAAGRKTVLIMDEVDGISGNEDRGGTQALSQMIKKTRIPIICIANDAGSPKMRTLKNYCMHLIFQRPSATQAEPRLSAICRSEGLKAATNAIHKLYEHTHGDLRATLNFLQMWKETHDTLSFDDVNAAMLTGAKDLDQDVFGSVPEMFRDPGKNTNWISDRESLYFLDSGLVPLFVQDAYLRGRPRRDVTFADVKDQSTQMAMAMSSAADSISDGDLMTAKIFGEQDYSFMPSHAMLSSIRPSWIMSGGGLSGYLEFPKWLGQNSTRTKRVRLLNEMKYGMQLDVPANFSTLASEYVPFFKDKLILPLIGPRGADHVDEVIEALDEYGMVKEDWDTILEVTKPLAPPRPVLELETKTKTDFTRKYNKLEHQLKVSRMKMRGEDGISRGKASALNADELEVNDVTANVDEDEEEADDDDKAKTAAKDPNVKQVKPRASRAKSAKPAKAKTAKAAKAKPTKAKTAASTKSKKRNDSDDDFIDDDSDFD